MAQWDSWGTDDQQYDLTLDAPAKTPQAQQLQQATATPSAPQASPSAGQPADPFAAMSQPWSLPASEGGGGVSGWDSGSAQPTSQSQPQPSSAGQTPSAGGASDALSKYSTQLEQLRTTTDPRQQAVLKDQIGRSVYGELKTAGHDVSWDGDQLVVDGRRYVIGDGSGSPDVMPRTEGAPSPNAMAPQSAALQQGAMTYGGTGLANNPGGTPFQGFNDERALAGGDAGSAKDGFRRIVGSLGITLPQNAPREAYGAILRDQVIPALTAQGYPVQEGNGVDTIRVFSNERGWEEIDVIGNAGANPNWWWGDLEGMGASAGGGQDAGPQPLGAGTSGASGVQTQSGLPTPQAPTVEDIGDFTPTGPGYTPGDISTEGLPSRSYDEILGSMGTYTPNTIAPSYNFDGFGDLAASTEAGTEGLINQLLANPESLDARTVDMLKAASREEQAQMAESLDEDLTGIGYDLGVDSSAWLGSEKLSAKRARDEAIIRGNRDIDVEAAKTNMGDRRAAAQLGAAYSDSKRGRNLAEAQAGEGNKQAASAQKLQADLANEQNVFNSAQLKSNNAVNAARVELEQAAALNDRIGLRESAAQAAAELGISRDKLMSDWAMAKANELTQRYGIDVSQFIDLTQLQTAHGEFKEDLAFRIMALAQQMELEYAQLGEHGRQFDVGAGIDLAELQQRANEFGTDSMLRSYGL